jgi:hypothetical protein
VARKYPKEMARTIDKVGCKEKDMPTRVEPEASTSIFSRAHGNIQCPQRQGQQPATSVSMLIHFPTDWAPIKTSRPSGQCTPRRQKGTSNAINANAGSLTRSSYIELIKVVCASLDYERLAWLFCRFGMMSPWYPRRCSTMWSSLVKPFVPFRMQLRFGQSTYCFTCIDLLCRPRSALRLNCLVGRPCGSKQSGCMQYCGSLESLSLN